MCGSNNILKQDTFYVCQDCGVKYTPEEAKKLLVEITDEIKTNAEEPSNNNEQKDESLNLDGLNKEERIAKLKELVNNAAKEEKNGEKVEQLYKMILQEDPNEWETILNYAGFHFLHEDKDSIEKQIENLKKAFSRAEEIIERSDNSDYDKSVYKAGLVNALSRAIGVKFLFYVLALSIVDKKQKVLIEVNKKKCLALAFVMRDAADKYFDYEGKIQNEGQYCINGAALGCIEGYVAFLSTLKPYLEPEDLDGEYVDEHLAYPISLLKMYKKDYKVPNNIDYL